MTIQLNAKQRRELTDLMQSIGFKLTPIKPKPKHDIVSTRPYKWKGAGRGVYWYKGISNDQVKGVQDYSKGRCAPSNWPEDIRAWYDSTSSFRHDWYCQNWQRLAVQAHYATKGV
jgi:hypothetical protein